MYAFNLFELVLGEIIFFSRAALLIKMYYFREEFLLTKRAVKFIVFIYQTGCQLLKILKRDSSVVHLI